MNKLKTEIKLNWWPSPQDYNEAIQVPQAYTQDQELRAGLAYTDALGLPRPVCGSFASVYRMHCKARDYALRLFLSNIDGLDERYRLISDFVQHDELPYTVTFDYLKNGIKVRGDWFPALKMDWVEGENFDDYIVENLANPQNLGVLADKFIQMMSELRRAGIAHGDLQHGNIIICDEEISLVDYDGMYVPQMQGFSANEIGHRNYQHPKRIAKHFGPYLDNFSAWVIYASLRALQIDPRLMHQLGGGDDCLLFKQQDFLDPSRSAAFSALERHDCAELQELARFIRAQLKKDPQDVPFLELPIPREIAHLEAISDDATGLRSGPRLLRGNLPDWLAQDNANALIAHSSSDLSPVALDSSSPQALGHNYPSYANNGPVSLFPSSYTPTQFQVPPPATSSSSLSLAPPPILPAPARTSSSSSSLSAAGSKMLDALNTGKGDSWIVQAKSTARAQWVKPTATSSIDAAHSYNQTSAQCQPAATPSGGLRQATAPLYQTATRHPSNAPVAPPAGQLSGPYAPWNSAAQSSHSVTSGSSSVNPYNLNALIRGTGQTGQLSSPAASIVQSIPAELQQPAPRKTKFNPASGHQNPWTLQALMVFNPIVWIMCSLMWTVSTVDADLTKHGVAYPAHIDTVSRYYSKGNRTNVDVSYKVNGRTYALSSNQGDDGGLYKPGGTAQVRALPSDPSVTEPLDAATGTKENNDTSLAMILALVNLILEGIIWLPAWHRVRLAENGIPVLAKVDNTTVHVGPKGEKTFKATVSYYVLGKLHVRTVTISLSDYASLQIGSTEIGLVDLHNNDDFVFYRFCCYHALPPQSLQIGNSAGASRP